MAIAVGLGQGRVNEIINGKRSVTRIDVFERIAEGLTMPTDARAVLGLASTRPIAPGTLTGQAEIARAYPSQADVARELRRLAATSALVDILAVRALGLVALSDSLLHGPLTSRETPVQVRVLLLDPVSAAASTRAEEIGESTEAFEAGIRLSLARLAELDDHPTVRLDARLYGDLPTWRLVGFDDTLYLSAFGTTHEGHRSGVYELAAAANGVLHSGFRRYFDDLWCRARLPERTK